ncbi:uncharacterized protein LOC109861679 isoform X2 [Pseudomyrmex gracilis]|uniref:uncharacterized protein LOC109861679 isoform X2 n=1 Tax=Pseudomyrmex gracilis TaxID=219809 RepID=UPI00099590DF|nr:uncharacterized protein LOC109861679 isoform X2 [Pseudomyrmex gracilis]
MMNYSSVKFRHIKSIYDSSTQIVNELGTTDVAVGDATAEIMVTTLGKIPNEMYYLEDTTHGRIAAIYNTESHTILDNSHITTTTIEAVKSDVYTDHSTLLVILLIVLLIILMICCITACIIARSRSKYPSFFTRSDIECSPRCSGVNQPLLSLDKNSDTTTKTSSGSTNN